MQIEYCGGGLQQSVAVCLTIVRKMPQNVKDGMLCQRELDPEDVTEPNLC